MPSSYTAWTWCRIRGRIREKRTYIVERNGDEAVERYDMGTTRVISTLDGDLGCMQQLPNDSGLLFHTSTRSQEGNIGCLQPVHWTVRCSIVCALCKLNRQLRKHIPSPSRLLREVTLLRKPHTPQKTKDVGPPQYGRLPPASPPQS